jgi:hypothetical protein
VRKSLEAGERLALSGTFTALTMWLEFSKHPVATSSCKRDRDWQRRICKTTGVCEIAGDINALKRTRAIAEAELESSCGCDESRLP